MGKVHTASSSAPLTGEQRRNRQAGAAFWQLMHRVAVVSGGTHLAFIALFYMLGATMLAWTNVGSVTLFALSAACLQKRWNRAAAMLIVLEILSHVVLAVRAIGWDSGFHYYLLVTVPVVVISPMKHRLNRPLMIATLMGIYVGLDAAMRGTTPYDTLAPQVLAGVRYFNVTVTFLLLTYLSSIYLKLVKKAERELRHLATTDPLTQLLNRRSLLEVADYELTQRKRYQAPIAFVLADIDHFKQINDRHGHAAGDAVLTAVSQVLRQALREQDSVARWGGEEFLILMPNATLESASLVAERLRQQVADIEVPVEGKIIRVSMTFGVSAHRDDETVDEPVKRADSALYQGKMAGRNQVVREAAA
jgi:diguanylate cyclase (GGDEF)-like protein